MDRRVNAILYNGDNEENLLINYLSTEVICSTITSTQMRTSVRDAFRILDLGKRGISCELVGVHSLQAGGEMAMKLQIIAYTKIQKQGRWSGATFLMYIQNQINHLKKGLLASTSTCLVFFNDCTNIAVIEEY